MSTLRLIRTETVLSIRDKIGPLWGVGFPLVLLVILGNVPSLREPQEVNGGIATFDLYVPVLILFNLAMLALIAVPTVLAGYRQAGVLRRLQTTPVGPARVLTAQLVANLLTAVVATVVFLATARFAFGVGLPGAVPGFVVAWLLVAAAMLGIGLLITALATGQPQASAIGTVLYFPLMFCAGLWVPITQMPPLLRDISHATPLGAGMQAFQDAYAGDFPAAQPLLILTGYAVVSAAAAVRWFRWS
ncbi:putative ABC transporter permease protein [Actinoplanes missouriensis 431]|uniref:Transport permease protein n=1 Tax=Actinoplanes missouriensis (strain ATCC 14538 / DSM 43046 / CBS 188.64 / JCM 3121 / NBRC 102363 / NCIMB 12654 / NRRL B-3342 / UNCC 431) TaxID=512565 RepID=I0H9L2_ACTM4|nr:ABC transporter permease [Actinoplanes missouriensis]BAL89699.1 putative ABC transporter permease protein [Actinoplanes missouriensis 431]